MQAPLPARKNHPKARKAPGEDSGSLLEAMSAQSKAALDEETGIPAQIQKWQELNGVLSNILENLRNIAAVIPTLNSDTNISAPGASAAGLALQKAAFPTAPEMYWYPNTTSWKLLYIKTEPTKSLPPRH